MRILIVADEEHLGVAIQAAQLVVDCINGSSITITDAENADELIECNGYDYVIKNPDLATILSLVKRNNKC